MVPGGVTLLVVDPLQIVDVEEHDGERLLRAMRAIQRLNDLVTAGASDQRASQVVAVGVLELVSSSMSVDPRFGAVVPCGETVPGRQPTVPGHLLRRPRTHAGGRDVAGARGVVAGQRCTIAGRRRHVPQGGFDAVDRCGDTVFRSERAITGHLQRSLRARPGGRGVACLGGVVTRARGIVAGQRRFIASDGHGVS